MSLEDVLSSRGRIRVLQVLTKFEELNISAIARKANLNYVSTKKHLQALKKVGLVTEKRFGRVRIFRFDDRHERARAIRELIRLWRNVC
jgi:DNA-binding transcriptional ArsR family regulator